MDNCMLDMKGNTIEFMVGQYACEPGTFSPLVESGSEPIYTKRDGEDAPLNWPGDGSI
jgi:hypothetical protein